MQQVRVKEIRSKCGKIKSGARMGEDYELVIIIGEDGSEFTTFDTGIKEVGNGGLLELEAIIKNNKTNITSFKILEKGKGPANPPGGARNGMTPEMWAEKDRLERASMEAMSAFRGIMELAGSSSFQPLREKSDDRKVKLDKALDKALDWAMARLEKPSEAARTYQVPKPEEKSEKEATAPVTPNGFANAGCFLKSCLEVLGMNKTDVLEALSIGDVSEIKDLNKTYLKLVEMKRKAPF